MLLFLLFSVAMGKNCYANQLTPPSVKVESVLFTDSTLVEVFTEENEAKILVEIANGTSIFFREYAGPFYVKSTKTLSFKTVHLDYDDSDLMTVKVFKIGTLSAQVLGNYGMLTDKMCGDSDIFSDSWCQILADEHTFHFNTESKKLVEVELLSFVNRELDVLPPKKVSLYAHLKNGQRVHIRTSNTIGSFKGEPRRWSHVLRLKGKPKLKKILRKTEYFSLTVVPKKKNDILKLMVFDELLMR